MATEQVKQKLQAAQQAKATPVPPDPARTVAAWLEALKPQLAAALPKHLPVDRLIRIVLTNLRLQPELARCTRESLLGAVMQCAQLGLDPNPALGHVYLVPFRRQGVLEVSILLGFKGLLELVRRSGQVQAVTAQVVYERDHFEVEFGTQERLIHRPRWTGDRGQPVAVYALARLRDGGVVMEVLSVDEVEAVRRRSRAPDAEPWRLFWPAMARKTAIRRLVKYLPLAVEDQRALAVDETVATPWEPGSPLVDGGDLPVLPEDEPGAPPPSREAVDPAEDRGDLARQLRFEESASGTGEATPAASPPAGL